MGRASGGTSEVERYRQWQPKLNITSYFSAPSEASASMSVCHNGSSTASPLGLGSSA